MIDTTSKARLTNEKLQRNARPVQNLVKPPQILESNQFEQQKGSYQTKIAEDLNKIMNMHAELLNNGPGGFASGVVNLQQNTTINRKPFVDTQTSSYGKATAYEDQGSQASMGFRSQLKQNLNSDVNFMMGRPQGTQSPGFSTGQSNISRQPQKIPDGIKIKKNIVHGTILGVTNSS